MDPSQPKCGAWPRVLLAEADPWAFLARFEAVWQAQQPVFLANPAWSAGEWVQVAAMVQPHELSGSAPLEFNSPGLSPNPEEVGLVCVPTGGSGGKVRFATHTQASLLAAARGFSQHCGPGPVNCLCLLPLYHVSGLMQVLRTWTTAGQIVFHSWPQVLRGDLPSLNPEQFFVSLVPTQLQRILQNRSLIPWLQRFATVWLGGAPPWPDLLEQARAQRIPLALTYGMTETAALVCALRPEAFLAGANHCGQALPHAQVTIHGPGGEVLGPHCPGRVHVKTSALARGYYGYYPEPFPQVCPWPTDDLGYLDEAGNLTILGRYSQRIFTGGEKVDPLEVETALWSTGLVQDVGVTGLPDQEWGELVAAACVPSPGVTLGQIQAALTGRLSRFKLPKRWLLCRQLPRTPQGKLSRVQLQGMFGAVLPTGLTNPEAPAAGLDAGGNPGQYTRGG